MTALLDADVLIDLHRASCLEKLLRGVDRLPWSITKAVRDELRKQFDEALLKALPVRPSPPIESAEALLAVDLLVGNRWKPLGHGEASSIAAAATDPSLVFVTWDRRATYTSLHELRGRTLTGHTLLGEAIELGILTADEAHRVHCAEATRVAPSWWPAGASDIDAPSEDRPLKPQA